MDHANLQMVPAVNMVLRWCVHIELGESKVVPGGACCAICQDFDGCAQVLEFNFINLSDIYGGLLRGYNNISI